MSSRRAFLRSAAFGAAALAGAPAVLRQRFQLFAGSPAEYSARTIRLMQEALVIDGLAPWSLDFAKQSRWLTQPETFTQADVQPYLDSGIHVWHHAVGFGGPNAYEQGVSYMAGGTASWPATTSA